MSMQHAQYVLLFLVLGVNSDQFQIYGVTRSYSSCPFLCALAGSIEHDATGGVACYCSQLFSVKKQSTLSRTYRSVCVKVVPHLLEVLHNGVT